MRFAFRSHNAMSIAAIACVATPDRPTDAPAQSSLSYTFAMSDGSAPISPAAISLACAYCAGPPARFE